MFFEKEGEKDNITNSILQIIYVIFNFLKNFYSNVHVSANKQNLALHAILFSYDETIKDAKHVSIKNAPKLFLAAPFPLQLLESA